ncbi:uncharacterized protein FFB20_06488 [Fusarium fujikuroi]|nr:uncharacterized protein FFE2_04162 [Fusarium fujikuroi]SCN80702.1 uncharacterized protein FFM5_02496 [Fusarium fujikuroi]SCN81567.1 uncharacterized protein FFB20_06488 [Fusarium fujikuroi]SCN97057.1 uncharacterized protein FFC1_07745 [Fusarium fujikuroi]SCO32826.1 uncharacterized protein FFMR_02600 [Fusarium fujikuroi]
MKCYQPIDPEDQESDEDNIFKQYLERFCLNMEYHTENFKATCKDARDELQDKLRCKFKQLQESIHCPLTRREMRIMVRPKNNCVGIRNLG